MYVRRKGGDRGAKELKRSGPWDTNKKCQKWEKNLSKEGRIRNV